MRHELYGDFRDVVKWSVALKLAGDGKWITQVAMRREDENQGEGRDYRLVPVPLALERVVTFFNAERRILESGTPKNLNRVTGLSDRVDVACELYVHAYRTAYFDEVTRGLNSRLSCRRDVVLVDPDNGLEPDKATNKHVCFEQLRELFAEMRVGDILFVYQHGNRRPGWKEAGKEALTKQLGLSPQAVNLDYFADVCFYSVVRPALVHHR